MTKYVTSNLSALSEGSHCVCTMPCYYPDAGGTILVQSKLCRFLDAPTQRILDELEQDLWMVCDSLAIDEFCEFGSKLIVD